MNAPVLIQAYNRENHIKDALNSLAKNPLSKTTILYVAIDKAIKEEDSTSNQKVKELVEKFKTKNNFLEFNILAWKTNKGSFKSYIDACEIIFKKYDKLIFFEDDIIVSNTFLNYMNDALNFYESDKRIFSIASYLYSESHIPKDYPHEVFLYGFFQPWGVGIWKDRFFSIDRECDGLKELFKNKEDLKRFNNIGPHIIHILRDMIQKNEHYHDVICCFNMFKKNQFTLYPSKSLSANRGFDGSGEHCYKDKVLQNVNFTNDFIPKMIKNIEPDLRIQNNIARSFYSFKYDTLEPILRKCKIYKISRMMFRILKAKNPFYNKDPKARM